MKARDVIDAAMSDWHAVDAAQMADETFDQIDADERDRLARRAYTEEWRSALRAKDSDGVPRYASLEVTRSDGTSTRVYKQTALFSTDDFAAAIAYHRAEAVAHLSAAQQLAKRCNVIHGTQLPIPGIEAPTGRSEQRESA